MDAEPPTTDLPPHAIALSLLLPLLSPHGGRVTNFTEPVPDDARMPIEIVGKCCDAVMKIPSKYRLDGVSMSHAVWPNGKPWKGHKYWEALKHIRDYWAHIYGGTRELIMRSCVEGGCKILPEVFAKLGIAVQRHVEHKSFRCAGGCDIAMGAGPTRTKITPANIRGWRNAMKLQFGEPNIIIGSIGLYPLIYDLRPGGCVALKINGIISTEEISIVCQCRSMFRISMLINTSQDRMFFIGIDAVKSKKLRAHTHRPPAADTLSHVNALVTITSDDRIKRYKGDWENYVVPAEWSEYFV